MENIFPDKAAPSTVNRDFHFLFQQQHHGCPVKSCSCLATDIKLASYSHIMLAAI
jgi:hypothetical protein